MVESSRLVVERTIAISRAKAQRLIDAALAILSSGADMSGICVKCEGLTESDERWHKCEGCGSYSVMGAEEITVQLENMQEE